MSQKILMFFVVAGALSFPAAAFAINQNGPAIASPINSPKFGAAMNRGIAGAAPFRRGVRVQNGPQGGQIPKK